MQNQCRLICTPELFINIKEVSFINGTQILLPPQLPPVVFAAAVLRGPLHYLLAGPWYKRPSMWPNALSVLSDHHFPLHKCEGWVDPFLFSHVWMSAHVPGFMGLHPVTSILFVEVRLELRSASCCVPTQLSFSHLCQAASQQSGNTERQGIQPWEEAQTVNPHEHKKTFSVRDENWNQGSVFWSDVLQKRLCQWPNRGL